MSKKTPNKPSRRTLRQEVNRDLACTFLFLLFVAAAFILIDYLLSKLLW
jgi:preprotein translocase subunit SecE